MSASQREASVSSVRSYGIIYAKMVYFVGVTIDVATLGVGLHNVMRNFILMLIMRYLDHFVALRRSASVGQCHVLWPPEDFLGFIWINVRRRDAQRVSALHVVWRPEGFA
jgi:hypothetical protein